MRSGLFDTVGSRVMALIVCTSLPLACVAGVLAWHAYIATSNNSFERIQADATGARHEIAADLDRAHGALEILARIGLREETAPRALLLAESINQQHYCSLALVDPYGKIVAASREDVSGEIICDGTRLYLTRPDSAGKDDGNEKAVEVILKGPRPVIRISVPLDYIDRSGETVSGHLVAFRPLVSPQLVTLAQYARPPSDPDSGATDLWVYTREAAPVALTPNQRIANPWSPEATARLDRDLVSNSRVDHFEVGSTYYTLAPGFGPASIVSVSVRSMAETRALQLFLARVTLIVLILIVELLLVALAAQRYLVEPLEKLAFSVADWRRHGTFQPDLPKSLPLEIRQMERAFSRATRRLDRHEARLQRAAKQQDLLIKEIHHRVKNNLQIVASLLNLQANRIKLPEAREEFHLVRDRVRSLATLHRHLYPEGGLSALDVRAFLEELASQIFTANNRINRGRISLSLIVESTPITPDQAVPLSLIVTEVVTNALRYAFPRERTGSVCISLKRCDDSAILIISDDGIGLANATREDKEKREGIGLQLVRGFARQLGATLEISSDDGTEYRLAFPVQTLRRPIT
ncbi:histidine kinase dimerization/phosphoacceptor domain -containing protein [Asaia sp. HN010]|uniref:histidine kinase dimerization/phosphoacceptor domain -containing protein n=1 Tax=Asaia sp. HN010 TaxID=3081233 RepID=UPI00301AD421